MKIKFNQSNTPAPLVYPFFAKYTAAGLGREFTVLFVNGTSGVVVQSDNGHYPVGTIYSAIVFRQEHWEIVQGSAELTTS